VVEVGTDAGEGAEAEAEAGAKGAEDAFKAMAFLTFLASLRAVSIGS